MEVSFGGGDEIGGPAHALVTQPVSQKAVGMLRIEQPVDGGLVLRRCRGAQGERDFPQAQLEQTIAEVLALTPERLLAL